MSAKKVVIIVLSSALALLLGFCTFWVINNYDALEYAMSGSALYTNADLEKAYEDGYNSAGYDVQDLNDQIADLRNKLETKTIEFDEAKASYEKNLKKYNDLYEKYLKKYNDLLDSSAEEETELNTTINNLTDKIAELEKNIESLNAALDSYIAFKEQVEAEMNKAVATFEYDGAVILVQSYDKGSKLENVVIPENTDEIMFNGWTVNGQAVDISDYTINESTTFVADLSYFNWVLALDGIDGRLLNVNDNYCVLGAKNYILNKSTVSWEELSIGGLDNIDTSLIWFYNDEIRYDAHYVLNKETFVWEQKYSGGNFYTNLSGVSDFWSDGEDLYYSYMDSHYILNKNTNTWETITINGGLYDETIGYWFFGSYVWSNSDGTYLRDEYVWNKTENSWDPVSEPPIHPNPVESINFEEFTHQDRRFKIEYSNNAVYEFCIVEKP